MLRSRISNLSFVFVAWKCKPGFTPLSRRKKISKAKALRVKIQEKLIFSEENANVGGCGIQLLHITGIMKYEDDWFLLAMNQEL